MTTGSEAPQPGNKWPLFERLQFLSNVRRERASFCNILREESSNNERVMSEDEDDGSASSKTCSEATPDTHAQPSSELPVNSDDSAFQSTPVSTSRALKRNHLQEMEKMSKKRLELLDHIVNKKTDDDVDLFMKSIALTVKTLPPHLISQAKLDILSSVTRLQSQAFYSNSTVDAACFNVPYFLSTPSTSNTYVNTDAATCERDGDIGRPT